VKKRLPLLAVGLLVGCFAWSLAADEPSTKPAGPSPFDADAYLAHVKYLASDDLGGRQPGTEGCELAAEYIARHFADVGLRPGGDDGTFFQQFEVTRGKKLVDDEASLKVEGNERRWQVRKDWIPLPFTSTEDVEAPLAFAGYGIKASIHDYDDYADFDATGKVLLMFRGEPQSDDPEAGFGGKTPSRYAMFLKKVQVASKQGAKAVLIVDPPKREGLDDTLYPWDDESSEQTYDLPIVHVSRALAEALVKKGGLGGLADLQEKLDRERKPLSADLHLTLKLRTGVKPNKLSTRNVLGLLRGDGSTDDTIVVGAHYDHLGKVPRQFDRKDDTTYIHNRADDNASGTAGVVELARVLAGEPRLRRNVLLIAFSAEELGLLGSAHFVEHPTIALKYLRAMVNFDMIGRFGAEKFTIYGVPSGREFAKLVDRAAEQAGIKYRAPAGGSGMFGASDHASFYDHDIPVLFPFTGVHKQYHSPEDDWELIDPAGATKILTVFHSVVRDLANLESGPTFEKLTAPEPEEEAPVKPGVEHEKELRDKEGGEKDNGSEQGPAEEKSGGEVERPTRPPVRLGIVPDFTGGDQPGVIASSVMEGGAAKTAGMQDGDRIVRIGEQKIKDIYGYMNALRDYKAGDTVDIVVVRKDAEITLKVALKESPRRRGPE
jgi:hypothetical protein